MGPEELEENTPDKPCSNGCVKGMKEGGDWYERWLCISLKDVRFLKRQNHSTCDELRRLQMILINGDKLNSSDLRILENTERQFVHRNMAGRRLISPAQLLAARVARHCAAAAVE